MVTPVKGRQCTVQVGIVLMTIQMPSSTERMRSITINSATKNRFCCKDCAAREQTGLRSLTASTRESAFISRAWSAGRNIGRADSASQCPTATVTAFRVSSPTPPKSLPLHLQYPRCGRVHGVLSKQSYVGVEHASLHVRCRPLTVSEEHHAS